ncbi:cytochrome P450 monooxygenase-like protein [Clohesyomyces aquaticus]|uniref:Cytochrome P450 monooxygenase-like protein n=1 Tax=Clohesyomyces aquaticus TaxID=1231657 RepID=A0A1Y1YNU7_9PLEO|nr:cytochrome P450 monooxygenase-like protein [Clohesyomyces aquaticus]
MSTSLPSVSPLLLTEFLSDAGLPQLPFIIACIIAAIALGSFLTPFKRSQYPLANPPRRWKPHVFARLDFLKHGAEILSQASKKFAGQPFRLITELGETIVLPPSYAHEIRNEEGLSFGMAASKDFHGNLPGFEPFGMLAHDAQIMQAVARKQLTKFLNTVTEPLSNEATFACDLIFGQSPEWKEVLIKDSILDLISRLSSRVFLGDELCRNPSWLLITKTYTVHAFKAATEMTILPSWTKHLLPYFSSDIATVRAEMRQAIAIINPVIARRREVKAKALAEGKPTPRFNDAIEWAEIESRGHAYDPAVFQLLLSFAAIHTTSDLIFHTLVLLASDPDLITPLREEMASVLRAEGWRKSALYNMKLLDSAIKETQRFRTSGILEMRRIATQDVTLPDGIFIPKGSRVEVDASESQNPAIYTDPEKFDIYRFKRMRDDPDFANKAQLVATSPEHLAFGHGKHACPGRFFAANEMKTALCHLMLKYDWKLAEGTTLEPINVGHFMFLNPEIRVVFRRREEEIDLEGLEFV